MTNLGPLTTTFTATGADCQSTYLAANNDNQWIQYGQPLTDQCNPPNFTPFQAYYYSPGICPSGYYYACEAGVGTSSTQATCCPTGFTCRTGINRATDPFACASTYASDTYVSVNFYKFTSADDSPGAVNTTSKTTTFFVEASGAYVEAYGPVVRRSAGDPEWGSTSTSSSTTATGARGGAEQSEPVSSPAGPAIVPSPTPTSGSDNATNSGGGGLSVGASVGIGVGVAVGCIIFISCVVAAYIIGKRRRAAAQGSRTVGTEGPGYRAGVPAPGQTAELTSAEWKPWELRGGYQHHQAAEVDAHHGQRSEMAADNPAFELQASPGHDRYT